MTLKAIFSSLIFLLRFRPIFPKDYGCQAPVPQLLHTPVPQVLHIPQTGLVIFSPTLLSILCFPSQLMVLPLPRAEILIFHNSLLTCHIQSSRNSVHSPSIEAPKLLPLFMIESNIWYFFVGEMKSPYMSDFKLTGMGPAQWCRG